MTSPLPLPKSPPFAFALGNADNDALEVGDAVAVVLAALKIDTCFTTRKTGSEGRYYDTVQRKGVTTHLFFHQSVAPVGGLFLCPGRAPLGQQLRVARVSLLRGGLTQAARQLSRPKLRAAARYLAN